MYILHSLKCTEFIQALISQPRDHVFCPQFILNLYLGNILQIKMCEAIFRIYLIHKKVNRYIYEGFHNVISNFVSYKIFFCFSIP